MRAHDSPETHRMSSSFPVHSTASWAVVLMLQVPCTGAQDGLGRTFPAKKSAGPASIDLLAHATRVQPKGRRSICDALETCDGGLKMVNR